MGQEGAPAVSVVLHARAIKILFEPVGSQFVCGKRLGLKTCLHRARRADKSQQRNGSLAQPLRARAVLVVDDRTCTAEEWENEMCEVFVVSSSAVASRAKPSCLSCFPGLAKLGHSD